MLPQFKLYMCSSLKFNQQKIIANITGKKILKNLLFPTYLRHF